MSELIKKTVKFHKDTLDIIQNMADKNGETFSETLRKLVNNALSVEWSNDNKDILAALIREQMDIVLKPHTERLAKLSSKTGHMAATATFLNVQAMMDLVPTERRKDPVEMYKSAKTKAAAYMKMPTTEFNEKEDI